MIQILILHLSRQPSPIRTWTTTNIPMERFQRVSRYAQFDMKSGLVLPIFKDEIKELEKEGEAALDVEDLRKKMMEAKLEADKAKTEVVEQKKEVTGGKEKKTTEDEVEKSKDVDGLGPKPEIEAEKKSSEK